VDEIGKRKVEERRTGVMKAHYKAPANTPIHIPSNGNGKGIAIDLGTHRDNLDEEFERF